MPRNTRRTAITAEPVDGKENRGQSLQDNVTAPTSKKARHRLSTAELARLEGVFKHDTHPSRQQKKDLAAQLKMDYKTITIWFQNKRQTSKRGQSPAERSKRSRADSCLRTVSSPSHNATLDGSGVVLIASPVQATVEIQPFDSLNASTPRLKDGAKDAAPTVQDVDLRRPQTPSENTTASAEASQHAQPAEQEQTKVDVKPTRWKRIRTLEWACERHAKRRKLSKEGYVRLGSEEGQEVQDRDPNDKRMEPALSLLSLASSAPVSPPKDVIRGVSLLLGFKHSWRRK